MPIYLIERINRDTGAANAELAEAPLLAIAFMEQEMKHGKDYKYRLVGRLENGNIVGYETDHNKVNKDRLDEFHRYQKAMNESSYTNPFVSRHTRGTISIALHNQAHQRYRLINRHPGKGGMI